MRPRIAALWVLSVVLAFALGTRWVYLTAPGRSEEGMRVALTEALREPDTTLRFERLAVLLGKLTPRNLPGAVAALESQQAFVGEAELAMAASAWARIDAPHAFERVRDTWPQRYPRRVVMSEIVYDWALRNPTAALDAVRSLPEGDAPLHEMVGLKLIEAWAQTPEYRSATDYVASLEQGGMQQELTTVIAQQRLKLAGQQGLIDWAESIREDTPGKFRLVAFRKAARMLAQVDPQAAAAWIDKHKDTNFSGVTRIVATQWAESDPEAAFAWLRKRPADAERDQAVGFAFNDWLRREPKRASEWLRAASPGPELDPATEVYARSLESDPQQAIAWAQRIQNEAQRNDVLTAIGQAWFVRDPAAARAWLSQAGLSPEVATAIQNPRAESRRPRKGMGGANGLPPQGPGVAPVGN